MGPVERILLGSLVSTHTCVFQSCCVVRLPQSPVKGIRQLSQEGCKSKDSLLCTAISLLTRRENLEQPHTDFIVPHICKGHTKHIPYTR